MLYIALNDLSRTLKCLIIFPLFNVTFEYIDKIYADKQDFLNEVNFVPVDFF